MSKKKPVSIEIDAKEFDQAVARVFHAAAKDVARPILNTVLFEGDEKGLRLVAADNYRIAIQDVSTEPAPFIGQAPVERNEIAALRAFLKGVGRFDKVRLTRDGQTVVVSATNGSIALRVVDGQFPNYRQVIGDRPNGEAVMLGINPLYLADVGKALKGQAAAQIYIDDPLKPVWVEGTEPDLGYREVIMPVRLPGTVR